MARTDLDFADLYEKQLPFVRSVLRRSGLSAASIDDAAQGVFLVVWMRWASYDSTRALRPWLRGIAVRVASDMRKRSYRSREQSVVNADAVDGQPGVDELLVKLEQVAMLRRALATLPTTQCEVVVRHELDELTIPEVARQLAVPLNTAYSRLRLGRRGLAARLGREVDGRRAA